MATHNNRHAFSKKPLAIGTCVLAAIAGVASAFPPPVTGVPVPDMAQFDTIMQTFMDTNSIDAGVLGILHDDCIVYMRGFGWDDAGHTDLLSPDQMFRLASVTKPVVAAAAVLLDQQVGGTLLGANAFDVGQVGGGILAAQPGDAYDPFPGPGPGDNNIQNITVQNLIDHQGGWDDDNSPVPPGVSEPDWTYREVTIAAAMGVSDPPGRVNTMRYILGRPLEFTPGTTGLYANTNYLALGLIIEQVSGKSLQTYIRQDLLSQFSYVNQLDIARGRTFEVNKHPREPDYHSFGLSQNVFDPGGPQVQQPHGGWDHEARVGQGGLISSAVPLLVLANRHTIRGVPIDPTNTNSWTHTGSLPSGTATVLRRRGDGNCFCVLFNRRSVSSGGTSFGSAINSLIDGAISAGGFTWPTQCVDGTWVDFVGGSLSGNGTFFDPFLELQDGIDAVPVTGRVQIKPGETDWTGTITKPLILNAPLGAARIGIP